MRLFTYFLSQLWYFVQSNLVDMLSSWLPSLKQKNSLLTLCLKDKRMNVVKMNFSIHNWEITSTRSNILTIIVCNGLENTVNKSYFLLNEAIRRRNPRLNLTNCCWSPWFLFKHFGVLLLDNFYLLLIHIINIDFFMVSFITNIDFKIDKIVLDSIPTSSSLMAQYTCQIHV